VAVRLRSLVTGNLEVVELFRPPASLYINEEGKLHDLPLNERATVITWTHNSAFRGRDLILGDAFIVGPVDDEGNDLTVPNELVELLFNTSSYRMEVQTHGTRTWSGNQLTWDNCSRRICTPSIWPSAGVACRKCGWLRRGSYSARP
jgi:hypothetical protein